MATNAVYIPSIDSKDLYLANHFTHPTDIGYNLRTKAGDLNIRKFVNTLDYSLDLLKIRDAYERVYRRKNFSFWVGRKEYTQRVINVTTNYAVKEYNRIGDIYLKNGWRYDEIVSFLQDSICVIDGELIAIRVGYPIDFPAAPGILGKYFFYEDGVYHAKTNIKTVVGVAEIRQDLYENGFVCDGIKYVRFKRSAGSSRIGKCLFIDEKLYPALHKWEMCGIKIAEGQEIDLAALESYIALTSSSIIDTVKIFPENILVIDDYESKFEDEVVAVRVCDDGHLVSKPERVKITNSIWDGQSLMDVSLFGDYNQYGMLLLRNRFFKSCCFNTNIQKFFSDNGITKLDQIRGFTLAKRIEDIKLITTPSSIKYLKFGRLREWLKRTDPTFGVVKHEKKTHFFQGRMVSTHYQLLNTLQMTQDEVDKFLEPSMEYVRQLKTNPAVMRYHLKFSAPTSILHSPMLDDNDIIYRLLGINNRFTETQIYRDFRNNLIRSYLNNIRRGHVLVDGNYSTLVGNPYCMLLASIGKFDGTSDIPIGHVMSKRFPSGKRLLGSRSPHVCQGNILLVDNEYIPEIDRYLNMTDEIICINSIGENILQRLSGCDFDSDTVMITDNPILIRAAERNYDTFKVPTSLVESKKTRRCYVSEQQADLDVKTSVNMIGEIINLSQELNSLFWDKMNSGSTFDEVAEIYYDVAMLDVMSGIEIDKAKKEFVVDNSAEYRRLKAKYERRDKSDRAIKPNFFGVIARKKGYYDSEKKCYAFHLTTMDFVQHTLNRFRLNSRKQEAKPFSYLIDPLLAGSRGSGNAQAQYRQVDKILTAARDYRAQLIAIHNIEDTPRIAKSDMIQSLKESFTDYVANIRCNVPTMYVLLKALDRPDVSDIRRILLSLLFGTANSSFYQMIEESREPISIATECLTGEIILYGRTFSAHTMNI